MLPSEELQSLRLFWGESQADVSSCGWTDPFRSLNVLKLSHVGREKGRLKTLLTFSCRKLPQIISCLPRSSSRHESNLLGSSCLNKIQTFIKRLCLLSFEKGACWRCQAEERGYRCSDAIDRQCCRWIWEDANEEEASVDKSFKKGQDLFSSSLFPL